MRKIYQLSILVIAIFFLAIGFDRVSAQGPTGGAVTVGKPWAQLLG